MELGGHDLVQKTGEPMPRLSRVGDLSQPYLNHRLGPNKSEPALGEGKFLQLRESMKGLEDVFFEHANHNPGFRHNKFVIHMDFKLKFSLRILRVDGVDLLIDPAKLYRRAQKGSFPNMTQKDRKKLLCDARSFGTLTHRKCLRVLSTLMKVYEPLLVVGWDLFDGTPVHFVRNLTRFNHILGLSDAVDQAMSNMNINVRFPVQQIVNIPFRKQGEPGGNKFLLIKEDPSSMKIRFLSRLSRKTHSSKRRRFDLILHYLREFPKDLEEKEYVKLIKLSLAGTFSKQMEQELPQGFENSIPLFPKRVQGRLDNLFRPGGQKKLKVQFYFNLLQSKALCAPVGPEMVKEAYEKHRSSLCRPNEEVLQVPPQMLSDLYEYGVRVGRRVADLYDPYSTILPNTMSSIESNRMEGGNRAALVHNGSLQVTNQHPLLQLQGDLESPRLEPYVVGLFGPPGSGKTTLVNSLVQSLRQRICPGLSRTEAVYSRSCATKHWDGYTNQPIVVLDDFGQNLSLREDLAEFMTLISPNDYVLPMAELSQKGTLIRAPIFIVTSNMAFGQGEIVDGTGSRCIEDPEALWRRFSLPLRLLDGELSVIKSTGLRDQIRSTFHAKKFAGKPNLLRGGRDFRSGSLPVSGDNLHLSFTPIQRPVLLNRIEQDIRDKFNYHERTFCPQWVQQICSYDIDSLKHEQGIVWSPRISPSCPWLSPNSTCLSMTFPPSPPEHAPRVKAHAIEEPLKVRMITLGECDTKVLQPFQQALFKYLGEQPQFCLTNGVKTLDDFEGETLPWIYRIEKVVQSILLRSTGNCGTEDFSDELWLSGDYTAATDNFPMSVTSALIEGILSQIDHEPTKAWVRWEVSPHDIKYPSGVGRQTSGQLMGSLLSFPLLCFLNDYVVSSSGFPAGQYLVNGDDVVARGTPQVISNWRERAPLVGLSLSVGKNFIDKDFCTINSQLFFRGQVCHTGKVSTQTRLGTTVSYCFAEAQFYWGDSPELKANFLIRNWRALKDNPRSLHFSVKHGGLGLVDTQSSHGERVDTNLAKRCFLYDILKPFSTPIRIPGQPFSFVRLPVIRGSVIREGEGRPRDSILVDRFLSLQESQTEEVYDDLSHSQLRRWVEKMEQEDEFKNLFRETLNAGRFNLEAAPERGFLEPQFVALTNGVANRVSRSSALLALKMLREEWENPVDDPFRVIDACSFDTSLPVDKFLSQISGLTELLKTVRFLENSLAEADEQQLDLNSFLSSPLMAELAEREEGDNNTSLPRDVLSFWETVEPESRKTLCGGKYYVPRPFEIGPLQSFLDTFASQNEISLDDSLETAGDLTRDDYPKVEDENV